MAFDFGTLEPLIHRILSAPGTDLATISAKRVRRQLTELDSSLTADFLKENKEEVDGVIAMVFEKVSGRDEESSGNDVVKEETSEDERKSRSHKRKQEDEEPNLDEADYEDSPPPKKPKKASKLGRELSDAELARKLDSEINSRPLRAGGKGRGSSNGSSKRGGKSRKSAAMVGSDSDSEDRSKRKMRKQPSGGAAKGGFAKEYTLSAPLSVIVDAAKLSRPQVVKQLWVYIKGHELQNPSNKREILCDANLRAVFGVDKINMFKMNQVLGDHLHEEVCSN